MRPARAQSIALSSLTLPNSTQCIVWDATRSRFFISSGMNVLMVNPETTQIEDTIPTGSYAGQIAVSGDGQYLYVALESDVISHQSQGTINRYIIQGHTLDLQIPLGQFTDSIGFSVITGAQAIAVLPGQPTSIVVATTDYSVEVFDGAVPRSVQSPLNVNSLYVRPSDGAIFGEGDGLSSFGNDPQMFWFSATSTGIVSTRSVPLAPGWDGARLNWNGNLVTNDGFVFDLNAGAEIGTLPEPAANSGQSGTCPLVTDASGTSFFSFQYIFMNPGSTASLTQYSLANFQPIASAAVTGIPTDYSDLSGLCGVSLATWGRDGILLNPYDESAAYRIYFLHTSGLSPLSPASVPAPTVDASGVIHLALAANGLAYDSTRSVLWASIPGNVGALGDSVISIDPATGKTIDQIYVGGEPGALALSADGSHLFAILGAEPAIASIDLVAKQSSPFSVLDPSSSFYRSAAGVAAISGQSNSAISVLVGLDATSVVAYDAGVPRKKTFNNGTGVNVYTDFVQAIFPADAANAFYAVNTALQYADNTHEVYRLTVDASGVTLGAQLNNLLIGGDAYNQPASLVYDDGRLFTSVGQIFTPDTTQLLGSVALTPPYGLPVSFSDQNKVVYVQSYSPQVSANLYDLTTLQPQTSAPLLTGPPCGCTTPGPVAVNVSTAVRAGASAVAIAANGQIAIAPLGSFQAWPSSTAALQSVSSGVQQVSIGVNALSVLPGTSDLLLATPSADGSVGNSIVTFNPATGQIENSTFVGSEPSILAAAPDGSAVYAYLSGEDNVARLNVSSGSRDLVFAADPTGGTSQFGLYDMVVTPDGGLAVTYNGAIGFGGEDYVTGADGAVAVFDGGVLRPQVDWNSQGPFAGYPATFNLALSDSGSMLYAYNSFLSSFELKRDAVSKQGAQWLSTTGGLIVGYTTTIRYAQGLLYTSRGTVVDPERSLIVGEFSDGWLSGGAGEAVVPDVSGGRVYFATYSGILVFDINTRALLGRLPINLGSNIFNYPQNVVRFGSDGLAFVTTTGQLFIVSISAIPPLASPIPSPQLPFIAANGIVPVYSSVPTVQSGSWVSIFGANLASTTATWDGSFPQSLGGTKVSIDNRPGYLWFVSPNQINVQVPDDSATGTVGVTVTTANGTASGSVSLAPFGPSLSLFDSQHVAAEILTPNGSGAYGAGTYDFVGPSGSFSFTTRPVKPGESLVLYGVGFGPTSPSVAAGQPFSATAPTTDAVTVTIGGQPAKVLFSGIVAAGLYQINVVVPSAPAGDQAILATVGGISAPSALVTVQ